jgi:hypothetical protein
MIFQQLVLGLFLTVPAYFVGFYGVKCLRAAGRGLSRLTMDTELAEIPRTMRGKTGGRRPVSGTSNGSPPPGGGGLARYCKLDDWVNHDAFYTECLRAEWVYEHHLRNLQPWY